ncbi:hypothetical protein LOTGIDRAFT_157425 [Lottia gigantea]|uniref:Uncharacterized protein n=1 Tax=Lottia gigantea TaxID=225164 RepID=V4B1Q2_LOTGI|nr:hypothetical protein LOTGIDRAFT_157425 [Lottia gigantea]ESP01251.1 hypothetical protein LOTGIDRAFT_157425 [Lottia gigantea]
MNAYKNDCRAKVQQNFEHKLMKSSMGKLEEETDEDRCPYNIIDMFGRRFKKDSRTWLHKSSRKIKANTKNLNKENIREIHGNNASPPSQYGIVEHEPIRIEEPDDSSSDSDNPYTIVDSMGRRFKKDSRTWLHKSSSKRKRWNIIEDEEDDVPELPDIPNTQPDHFCFKDSGERDSERKFHETVKTGTDISKKHHSNVLMRKRKQRCQQISNSANYLPNDNQHNAEICMILSAELHETANRPTAIKRSISFDNIFELFEEDTEDAEDDCVECQQMSNNSRMSNNWRETKPITSDTSTLSSNENREINHSPLSSGASINLSSDTRIKRSPELTSTATDNNPNKPGYYLMPDVSPVRFNQDQTSNCEQYKANQTLNVNSSRSLTFLIQESDEFLGDAVLSEYEEESD